MTKSMRSWMVLGIAFMFSGCLHVKAVHYVNHHGDSDSGGYQMHMNSLAYLSLIADNPKAFDGLYGYSKPSLSFRDGRAYISDLTGTVSMEHFYDYYTCNPSPNKEGWSDCSFSINKTGWDFPDWSFDLEVVLHEEMIVLKSDHHRKRVSRGKPTLMWHFDGNRVSAFNVNYTVRVPNA